MSQNSVDALHFPTVHGYTDVGAPSYRTEGCWLESTVPARWSGFELSIRTTSYGLGYSLGEVELPALGLHVRDIGLATPTMPVRYLLRLATTVRISWVDSWPAPVRAMVRSSVTAVLHQFASWFASCDFPIWHNRRHLEHPRLAEGEKALAAHRRWASQFYPPRRADADQVIRPAVRA